VLVAVALKNVGIIEDDSDVLMVLQVANTSRGSNGLSPLESMDISGAYASDEGEQCSLYGTGESELEEVPEMEVNNDGDAWIESLEDMKSCSYCYLGCHAVCHCGQARNIGKDGQLCIG